MKRGKLKAGQVIHSGKKRMMRPRPCLGKVAQEATMDNTTLLIIVILLVLLLGGGWYGRGRWF